MEYKEWYDKMKVKQNKLVEVFNHLLTKRKTKKNMVARKELYRLIIEHEKEDIIKRNG